MKSHWSFLIMTILLGGAGFLLQARNTHEIIPARQPLSSFPRELGGRESADLSLSKETLDVLGPGDFLMRDYGNDKGVINLFIAYFPTQRAGDTIHSPKNCLPGAGWFPVQADRIMISVPGKAAFPANRYLIAKGEDRQLVLYWYWAHDRAVASEYAAKFYLVTDSIRMHRSDGSLIRITAPIRRGQSEESAQQNLLAFAADIVPVIDAYVPR